MVTTSSLVVKIFRIWYLFFLIHNFDLANAYVEMGIHFLPFPSPIVVFHVNGICILFPRPTSWKKVNTLTCETLLMCNREAIFFIKKMEYWGITIFLQIFLLKEEKEEFVTSLPKIFICMVFSDSLYKKFHKLGNFLFRCGPYEFLYFDYHNCKVHVDNWQVVLINPFLDGTKSQQYTLTLS